MERKELIKRYQALYTSGVDAIVFLGLAKVEDFAGSSDEQIIASEKEDGLNYPASICAYLQTFGEICNMQDSEFNIGTRYSRFKVTRELITMKRSWTNSKTIKEYLKENDFRVNFEPINPIEGEYTPRLSEVIDLNNINIFLVEVANDIYHFYDSSASDNPEIFYYVRGKGVVSNFISVTDTYRRSIFYLIGKYAPYGYKYIERMNKDTPKSLFDRECPPEKEWLHYYSEWFQNASFHKINELNRHRDEYYLINQEQEKKENRILTLDEFETNFINFIKLKY